jgi:hypothetical protein
MNNEKDKSKTEVTGQVTSNLGSGDSNQSNPGHGGQNPGQGDEHQHEKIRMIYINTREVTWTEKSIGYAEVIKAAYPGDISNNDQITYTVTYKRGIGNKPEGIMTDGDVISVKNEMIFNVKRTNRS